MLSNSVDDQSGYLRGSATISDEEWVTALATLGRLEDTGNAVSVFDLAAYFNIHPNRVRSKARRARRRALSDGCTCGCRGDLFLMPLGVDLLAGQDEDAAFDYEVIATFSPRHPDTLRPDAMPSVGQIYNFRRLWSIAPKDGGAYVGQAAWRAVTHDGKPVDGLYWWVPTEDLGVLHTTAR